MHTPAEIHISSLGQCVLRCGTPDGEDTAMNEPGASRLGSVRIQAPWALMAEREIDKNM